MTLLSQIKVGISEEFTTYKKHPKLIFFFFTSALVSCILQFLCATPRIGKYVPLSSSQAFVYFTPILIIFKKAAEEKQTNFVQFLKINGMRKRAYQLKMIFWNFFLLSMASLLKIIDMFLSFKYYPIQDPTFLLAMEEVLENPVLFSLQLAAIYFVVAFAVVTFTLFISSFCNPTKALLFSLVISVISPYLYMILYSSYNVALIRFSPFFSVIPSVGAGSIIDSLIEAYASFFLCRRYHEKSVCDKIDEWWTLHLPVAFVSGFLYFCFYLWRARNRDRDSRHAKEAKVLDFKECQINSQDSLQENILLSSPFSADQAGMIQLKSVKKKFENTIALSDISFSIYEQESFCLLGHNGAGKTTLINILTGILRETEGEIKFLNKEVFSSDDFKAIGFCPQKDAMMMGKTVKENLDFFAKIKGVSKDQVDLQVRRVMGKMDLQSFEKTIVSQLSGGFRRKLNVAIALLNDPKILIMDEPTSGMDSVSRKSFWKIIEGLKRKRKTIIFTTQFFDEVEKFADRIAVLSKGQLFAIGSVEKVTKELGNGYTLAIENSNNPNELKNQIPEISRIIFSLIPSAYLYAETKDALKFILPFKQKEKFSELFAKLEELKGLQLSIQATKLEETFLSLESRHSGENAQNSNNEVLNDVEASCDSTIPFFNRDSKLKLFRQFKGVVYQRLCQYQMDRKSQGGMIIGLLVILILLFLFKANRMGLPGILYVLLDSFFILPIIHLIIDNQTRNINSSLRVMGLKSIALWLGNYLADLIIKTPLLLCVLWDIYAVEVKIKHLPHLLIVCFSYSLNIIPFLYNLGLFFRKSEYAVPLAFFFYLFGLFSFLDYNDDQLTFILLSLFISPLFSFIAGYRLIFHAGLFNSLPFYNIWIYVLLSFTGALLQFTIILLRESRRFNQKTRKGNILEISETQGNFTDVNRIESERRRLDSISNHDIFKMIEATNIYAGGKKVLNNLSFGIQKGQIFGLLGPNGAGKTTTFNIMIGEISLANGQMYDKEGEIACLTKSSYSIGLCSQKDTLWPDNTVLQHLKAYAFMKGMSSKEAAQAVEYFMEMLDLKKHSKKKVKELSEGLKRKLCVAIALIGSPDVILLDEPTTGVDPMGRKQILNLLKVFSSSGSSVILSTHYVEDAQHVADKLGILVNGCFSTIGSMKEIRKKYEDYLVVIEGAEQSSAEEIERVLKTLARTRLDPYPEEKGLVFRIPIRAMKFTRIFNELEQFRLRGSIKDFSIYTTDLDQIFLKLAVKQMAPN